MNPRYVVPDPKDMPAAVAAHGATRGADQALSTYTKTLIINGVTLLIRKTPQTKTILTISGLGLTGRIQPLSGTLPTPTRTFANYTAMAKYYPSAVGEIVRGPDIGGIAAFFKCAALSASTVTWRGYPYYYSDMGPQISLSRVNSVVTLTYTGNGRLFTSTNQSTGTYTLQNNLLEQQDSCTSWYDSGAPQKTQTFVRWPGVAGRHRLPARWTQPWHDTQVPPFSPSGAPVLLYDLFAPYYTHAGFSLTSLNDPEVSLNGATTPYTPQEGVVVSSLNAPVTPSGYSRNGRGNASQTLIASAAAFATTDATNRPVSLFRLITAGAGVGGVPPHFRLIETTAYRTVPHGGIFGANTGAVSDEYLIGDYRWCHPPYINSSGTKAVALGKMHGSPAYTAYHPGSYSIVTYNDGTPSITTSGVGSTYAQEPGPPNADMWLVELDLETVTHTLLQPLNWSVPIDIYSQTLITGFTPAVHGGPSTVHSYTYTLYSRTGRNQTTILAADYIGDTRTVLEVDTNSYAEIRSLEQNKAQAGPWVPGEGDAGAIHYFNQQIFEYDYSGSGTDITTTIVALKLGGDTLHTLTSSSGSSYVEGGESGAGHNYVTNVLTNSIATVTDIGKITGHRQENKASSSAGYRLVFADIRRRIVCVGVEAYDTVNGTLTILLFVAGTQRWSLTFPSIAHNPLGSQASATGVAPSIPPGVGARDASYAFTPSGDLVFSFVYDFLNQTYVRSMWLPATGAAIDFTAQTDPPNSFINVLTHHKAP